MYMYMSFFKVKSTSLSFPISLCTAIPSPQKNQKEAICVVASLIVKMLTVLHVVYMYAIGFVQARPLVSIIHVNSSGASI